MTVLGGRVSGNLDRRSPDAGGSAALRPPSFRPPFRRPPALDIVSSCDSIELDSVPTLLGEESSDESADGRSGPSDSSTRGSRGAFGGGFSPLSSILPVRDWLRNRPSDSATSGAPSAAFGGASSPPSRLLLTLESPRNGDAAAAAEKVTGAGENAGGSAIAASPSSLDAAERNQRGRNAPGTGSGTDKVRNGAAGVGATPSPAGERTARTPPHPRGGGSPAGSSALGAFGSFCAVDGARSVAALRGTEPLPPVADGAAGSRSGSTGMWRNLNRGSSSSSAIHVRRNSTGASSGFGGRGMLRANSSNESLRSLGITNGGLASPSESRTLGDSSPASRTESQLERASDSISLSRTSLCSPSPQALHARETATVTGDGSFSFDGGSTSGGTSGGSSNASGKGGGSPGGWGVGSIWRSLQAPVSPIFRPRRHSATSSAGTASNAWGHASPTSKHRTICPSASTGSNDFGPNGVGVSTDKPPRHHRWKSADWSLWAGPALSAARPSSASGRRVKSLNQIPPNQTLRRPPCLHIPPCPSVPETSLEAPPLLQRSRTEEYCGALRVPPLPHEAKPAPLEAASRVEATLNKTAAPHDAAAVCDVAMAYGAAAHEELKGMHKDYKPSATVRGFSGGSFSEGCIPLVPDAGSVRRPHFVAATEHRLFCGLNDEPPRFTRSSTALSNLQHLPTAQPEPSPKLAARQLPAQQVPAQKLAVKKPAAAANMVGAGGGTARAPAAPGCDPPKHALAETEHGKTLEGKGFLRKDFGSCPRNNELLEAASSRRQVQRPPGPHVPRQTHRRRMRRVGSEPGFQVDRRLEAEEERERSRELDMGGMTAVQSGDLIVRSPDSGWSKVGGVDSSSPGHRGGVLQRAGERMFLANGGGSSHSCRGGMSMTIGMNSGTREENHQHSSAAAAGAGAVAAAVQSHVAYGSNTLSSPFPLVVRDACESSKHNIPWDGSSTVTSSDELRCGEGATFPRCSSPSADSSLFLASGVSQKWRPAMNHPLFSGRAVGVEDFLFSP
ncbi:hypothetical protein CLOM_g2901 [Closterium sp. NIES-68]|nr:hypothetical protein CLOM_g2901 [Closterium sp. NIES-68]GJP79085.1 hypothetical protein CLOP_g9329 [Closterium sp. NIES-67]